MDNFTPCENRPDFHAVVSIQLAELIDGKMFSWTMKPLKDCFSALDAEDRKRLQTAFVERNMWREISIVPPLQWLQQLAYKIRYELVPKYLPLYTAINKGEFDPLHIADEYYKERIVDSDFPETLLNGSEEVYLSRAHDREYEKVEGGNAIDLALRYYEDYYAIDTAFLNELDVFFIDLWSVNANGL